MIKKYLTIALVLCSFGAYAHVVTNPPEGLDVETNALYGAVDDLVVALQAEKKPVVTAQQKADALAVLAVFDKGVTNLAKCSTYASFYENDEYSTWLSSYGATLPEAVLDKVQNMLYKYLTYVNMCSRSPYSTLTTAQAASIKLEYDKLSLYLNSL